MRLTLDQAWTLCLKQWRYIIRELKRRPYGSVVELKIEWLKKHGYENYKIHAKCFFCEYGACVNCPGRKIDPDFHCGTAKYSWCHRPHEFFKKLKELHKKYKSKIAAKKRLI